MISHHTNESTISSLATPAKWSVVMLRMQLPEVWDLLQARPVELQVLARREVPVGAVVPARDVGELAQLPRREQPVGDRDAQHRRVALDVQAVAQPQRAEIVLAQLAGEEAPRLVAELLHALVHDALVDRVVEVHAPGLSLEPC